MPQFHDELGLLVGYHQGRYGFVELGLGRDTYAVGHLPVGWGYHAGVEVRVDRPDLYGLKVGAYAAGVFAMGVQLIQYREGTAQSVVVRPELGLGMLKGKLTYAYNIGLSPTRLPGINTHMISFSYGFRLMRLGKDDIRQQKRLTN